MSNRKVHRFFIFNDVKDMKKVISLLLVFVTCMILLSACRVDRSVVAEDQIRIQLICESKDIYQIYYTCYIDEEYFAMGGFADLDGNELTADSDCSAIFSKDYFEGRDISGISFDFSPYGKNDKVELATTNQVSIPAQYGISYTIIFSGNINDGFTAELAEGSVT